MRVVSSGNIYYYEDDMLGSARTMVQAGCSAPAVRAVNHTTFEPPEFIASASGFGPNGGAQGAVGDRRAVIRPANALGAEKGDIYRLVLGQGFRLTLAGLVVGTALAVAFTRLLKAQLFGVSETDAITFISVGLFLGVVALVACHIPARRAMRVDPMVALRHE